MKNLKTTLLVCMLFVSTALIVSPAGASVYNYEITDITQTAPDTIVVTARCLFCGACNPNNPGSSDRGDGCIPFACGYPPPSFPAYAPCQRGSPDGRFAAIRITGSFGSKTQKLICDQSNWPLNTLWSHNFIFSGLSFTQGETISIEADFYCSYCRHWYATPKKFLPNPYTLVFIPLNWQGSLSSFETYAQNHFNFLVDQVDKLTTENTKIVKVSQNLQLSFDKSDSNNFGDSEWNAIIDHAKNNGATGDFYIALTNEDLWGRVAGMNRAMYGNVIIIDEDGLGETETLAHEVGHGWGLLEEYNYIRWLAEKNEVREGYSYNSYPTTDDPNMPYPPPNFELPDFDPVRCSGRSFDNRHCIMGPAGYWYAWRWYLGPIPVNDYVYFGWPFSDGKGFCPDCSIAVNTNIDKLWGASGKGLAELVVTFFKNGTSPKIEHMEGISFAGKSMCFEGPSDYSVKAYSETGTLFYSSNVSCSYLTNLLYTHVNSTAKPLEVDSRTIVWFVPAFSHNKITVEIVDNIANQAVASREVLIAPAEAWIDYETTDKGNYNFGDIVEVTTEVNTTETSMNVVVDATLFDPNGVAQGYGSWTGTIYPTPDPLIFHLAMPSSGITGKWKVYVVVLNSTGQFQDSEISLINVGGDISPPISVLTVGVPQYTDGLGNLYVTSTTQFSLDAADYGGSGVASTGYRTYNSSHSTGWTTNVPPIDFQISGLDDGEYFLDYNSTDNAGNVEITNTKTIILDNTAPLLTVETPSTDDALQDGVTFKVSAWDLSAVASVTFCIQCPQGNIISPEFQSMPATLGADGKWSLYFDTRQLPDGFYLFVANGTDVLGNWGITIVQFSIRNWASIELLPASQKNNAGRTMPVKFSIRVKASVDPAQPFIYNEELTIKIYRKGYPGTILQTSKYGTTPKDYRIDPVGEKYITNFKTLSAPATYVVEIYRKGMLIGSFQFYTVINKMHEYIAAE